MKLKPDNDPLSDLETTVAETEDLISVLDDDVTDLDVLVSILQEENAQLKLTVNLLLQRMAAVEAAANSTNTTLEGKKTVSSDKPYIFCLNVFLLWRQQILSQTTPWMEILFITSKTWIYISYFFFAPI